jgi:hypothetical protein
LLASIPGGQRLARLVAAGPLAPNRFDPRRGGARQRHALARQLGAGPAHARGRRVRSDFSEARMHLLINLVSSTILQCLLDPSSDVSRRALLAELTLRVEEWIRP